MKNLSNTDIIKISNRKEAKMQGQKIITFRDINVMIYLLNVSHIKSIDAYAYKSEDPGCIIFCMSGMKDGRKYTWGENYKMNENDIKKAFAIISDFMTNNEPSLDLDEAWKKIESGEK
jgi:hypothetical protein